MSINTVDEYLEKLQSLEEIMTDLSKAKNQSNNNLDELHDEICDLQHYIELGTFNAAQGYKTLMDLKRVLCERRKVKDLLYSIDKTDSNLNNTYRGIKSVSNGIEKVTRHIEGNSTRTYTVRKRTDLVDKIKGSFVVKDNGLFNINKNTLEKVVG